MSNILKKELLDDTIEKLIEIMFKDREIEKESLMEVVQGEGNSLGFELLALRYFSVDAASYMVYKLSDERTYIMDSFMLNIKDIVDPKDPTLFDDFNIRVSQYSEAFKKGTDMNFYVGSLFAFFNGEQDNLNLVTKSGLLFSDYLKKLLVIIAEYKNDELENESVQEEYEDIDFKQLNLKMNMEIHFHQQDQASVFLEDNLVGVEKKFGEILLFCTYVLRQVVNLNNSVINNTISELLSNVHLNMIEFTEYTSTSGVKLVPYQGSKGRKSFIGELVFNSPREHFKFNLNNNGFGIFGGGQLGYYVPNSFVLLLKYLIVNNQEDFIFLERLGKACSMISSVISEGTVNIRNQGSVAFEISVRSLIV